MCTLLNAIRALREKLALKPKTLDDNAMMMMMMMVMLREEAKGDGSRQKISIVEQKEKIRILSHCCISLFLFSSSSLGNL